ncbi:hypothetical protein BDR04DRAFT_1099247 [Suillus decipiens]|nr:hypothetical protein BDR04DRAFT_1099247 [Suillus decipiens]
MTLGLGAESMDASESTCVCICIGNCPGSQSRSTFCCEGSSLGLYKQQPERPMDRGAVWH